MFRRFDVNSDAKLDVSEATTLIKATVREMGLTDEWVTAEFVTAQIAHVDTDGDSSTLTQDEYTRFMENIMGFVSQLGSVAENPMKGTADEGEADAAGAQKDSGEEEAEDEPAEPVKPSCACVIC
uniref:EF-hand domain-containing protein n=1 Tax=Prymnesium polylepis TaxID=72548 RepID=A0A7S4I458_9EUKA|mmetsp:Transcript_26196/g.64986  ORF Transcript_26196/g.64986 Transcript_26196/m.64986 type:complete len:125 (+) Transcript_26196:3-377(+)